MSGDTFNTLLEEAEPIDDELDRKWVLARVEQSLFSEPEASPPSVGRFILGEKLGVGGMGVVFAARDPELERDVAIKIVRVRDKEDRTQTHLEAQALARVSHPNVVAVHDVDLIDDQVTIVMELVRGRTLRDYVADPKRDVADVVGVYRQAARGLVAAHAQALIHRDFKPDNAVLGDDDRVRVIDFGLACEEDGATSRGAGTVRYMPPEQSRGIELTAAADQYAFCASLGEALSTVCGANTPRWLESIVDRGTSSWPLDRFPDMTAVVGALGRDPKLIRRKRLLVAGLLAAVVGAFAIGSTLFSSAADVEPCLGGESQIEAAWPAADWQEASAKLAAASDFGRAVAERIDPRITSFRSQWASVHRGACMAHERGEQSLALLDRQMVCLDRAKRAFGAAARLVGSAATEDFAKLAVVIRSLPVPHSCFDLDALTETAPPTPAIAEQVAELENELAEILVLLDGGQYEEARASASSVASASMSLGYQPLVAEAMLVQGRALMLLNRLPEAKPILKEASGAALASGANRTGVEAWARWAYATAMMGAPEEPLAAVDVIRALAMKAGAETFVSALLENNIGTLHIASGDNVAAQTALARAAVIARELDGPGVLEAMHSIGNLALVTTDPSARDQLALEAVERLSELVGADHPQTLRAKWARARFLSPSLAGGLLDDVCKSWRKNHPRLPADAASCHFDLAWIRDLEGKSEEAKASAALAVELGHSQPQIASALRHLFAGAFDQVIAELSPDASPPIQPKQWWLRMRLALIQSILGQAYQKTGDPRGRALLTKARAALLSIDNPVPIVKMRLQSVEKWLSEAN